MDCADKVGRGKGEDYAIQVERMALKNLLKLFVKVGLNYVNKHPKFRLYVVVVFYKLGLDGVARSVYMRLKYGGYSPSMDLNRFIPKDASDLSPRARQIYVDLKAAIEHRQKEKR